MRDTKNLERTRKINKKLRLWFKEHNITIEEIAQRMNITRGSATVMLSDRAFGEERADAWSKEFGISKRFLLTGEGPVSARQSGYQKIVSEVELLHEIVNSQRVTNDKLRSELERYRQLYGPLPKEEADMVPPMKTAIPQRMAV